MDRPWLTVVGVVRDERHNGLTAAIKEKFVVPYAQFPAARGGDAARNVSLVVRTAGDPAALAGPIRAEVRRLDPSLPIANIRRMTDVVAASMATPRLTGSLLTIFGGLALFLAAVGVSGVLSYLVRRRRREIGIRMAHRASRASVLALLIRRGVVTAAPGRRCRRARQAFLTRWMEGSSTAWLARPQGRFGSGSAPDRHRRRSERSGFRPHASVRSRHCGRSKDSTRFFSCSPWDPACYKGC
jgi:hypothetical protein